MKTLVLAVMWVTIVIPCCLCQPLYGAAYSEAIGPLQTKKMFTLSVPVHEEAEVEFEICYEESKLEMYLSTTEDPSKDKDMVMLEVRNGLAFNVSGREAPLYISVSSSDLGSNHLGVIPFSIRASVSNQDAHLVPPFPGDCGYLAWFGNPKDHSSLEVTFVSATSQHEGPLSYSVCQSEERDLLEQLDMTQDEIPAQVQCSDYFEGHARDLLFASKSPKKITFFTAIVKSPSGTKGRYRVVEYEHIINITSNIFLQIFVVSVFFVACSVTFGWIGAHSVKNKRMFKLENVVKTSFPSSFVLPIDLKTSRLILSVICAIHLACSIPAVFLGWVSVLLLITPVIGICGALMYSPLLGSLYMVLNALSIAVYSYFLITLTFAKCALDEPNETLFCDSLSVVGSILFLVAILVLFLFEFLAYSFVYRLLRYKLWLSEQTVLADPGDFEYHKFSSDKE